MIKERKDLHFVVIYTREPHARQLGFKDVHQPKTIAERIALARRTKKEFAIDATFLVDPMGDPSRKLFGDVPNPAIFIEKGGRIRDKLSWADGSEVRKQIESWKPAPVAPPKPDGQGKPKGGDQKGTADPRDARLKGRASTAMQDGGGRAGGQPAGRGP